ncbi:prepilin-type N-terminal cleavage/methylation domain-containing protein [Candidatus Kaiserbacteria bacterium]|nr:prepilin-type N-terminal cleavage/methylation domain-containing protein [Candidatus Kaiserbacteria bacterium]
MILSKHLRSSESGFSLIEILVGIGIFTLIGIAIYTFQRDVFSLNRVIVSNLSVQDEVRRTLKIMSAEIRTASPSSLGAYALTQTATSSFTFYSNIDSDASKERVRYFLSGTTLKKGVIKPSGSPLTYNPANEVVTELIHDLANTATSTFTYYDEDYDGTSPPLAEPIDISAVRLVKIMLVIDKDPAALPASMTLTTQVSIRNLKDNL